ncbi:MAG TPA: DivIVA domain-containing protein [Candidatus Alectryocaccomicrobium excrementavium]|uniref:DivIVA domain-containing protein n=1 Tax=Candidatus Alectryocaccomicrobium excrementavium TaxID=2840668 RepID=A0A9D1FZX4_9FIRM|nr:DivIVA domain-containing protein [Candidatus Alectryocaccomicrobium excrementavium]
MAITVRDIRSKQFTTQRSGYNKDEVDDFLDELADQLEELIKENLSLAKQLKERPVVESEPVIIEKPVEIIKREEPKHEVAPVAAADSAYDEPSYFKNLETTLRETLINAQRIADETVAEARKKSKQMVASAEEQANAMLASAKVDTEAARKEAEEIRKAAGDYRARFIQLVEDQMHILKADDLLFE